MRRFTPTLILVLILASQAAAQNWYEKSFFLLHEDHHTRGDREVGRDADQEETSRLVGLCRPDMIQIHAKGNPGWTTYPSEIGHTPPQLACDVLDIWKNVARADDYHFSVYYNLGRDAEIMTRRPEWNRVQADGKPWDRALCYHSGVAENYLWPMIREVMVGYEPDGWWFDGSCFTVRVCYCDKCRDRFRNDTGLEAPETPEQPGWTKYQEMQRAIYRECIHETCKLIHEIDPDCLVSVNWAYSVRMPEKPDPGIAYLTGDIGNRVEGLSAEAHWYDSVGLPFDLMTQLNTQQKVVDEETGRETYVMRPKPGQQLRQEMAVVIANGGRFNVWDSPSPESGLEEERFQVMGEVVETFLRSRQPWCLGSERLPDISLLHDAASHYAVGDRSTACFDKRNNRIDGATSILPGLHLNYEMLPDWRLESQDIRGRLVVVEHAKKLAPETVAALVKYVQQGGRLLLTAMSLVHDSELQKALGIESHTGPKSPEPLVLSLNGEDLSFQHWLFRLKLSTAETLLSVTDAQGASHPILTKNQFGKGTAYYVPIPLMTPHGDSVVPPELLKAVFDTALPPKHRQLVVEGPDDVEVVLRRQGDERVVHLVNTGKGQREEIVLDGRRYTSITNLLPAAHSLVTVELPSPPTSVRLEPQHIDVVEWEYGDSRLHAQIPGFSTHQLVVIECE